MIPNLNCRQYRDTKSDYHLGGFVLQRITCHLDDEYPGIYSTNSSAPSADLIYACKFAPYLGFEHILGIANEDGKIALQDTNVNGKSRAIQGFQAHENAIFDISWNHESWKMVTASGDQTCLLMDIGTSTITPIAVFRGHSASIKSVDFCQASTAIFASGSRDGSIMVWDIRRNHSGNSKAENIIRNAHPVQSGGTDVRSSRSKKKVTPSSSTANSVTSAIFQSDCNLISAGAADGNIHIWDLRKNYTAYKGDPLPKFSIPYGSLCSRGGVTNLLLDPGKSRLYASCMDDVIFEFNAISYSDYPLGTYVGHEQHSFYIKSCLSGDGRYLLSGSSDDHAYVWRVGGGPRPMLKLDGHSAEVTCVAWSAADLTKIVTCADDVRHRIWRVNNIDEDTTENRSRIRGRACKVDSNTDLPKIYGDVQARLKKKSNSHNITCRTPRSIVKSSLLRQDKTPDVTPVTPGPSTSHYNMRTPRTALSPLPENNALTPNDSICGGNRAAASRRLDLSENDYASPTRDLPNYVIDGLSPHARVRSGTKRKKLDWLTDLSRKMSPNTQNKVRKIK